MQGGALAACVSVKVTVDFCCTLPFLISMTNTVHTSLSHLSLSLSFPHPHTHTRACWETHKCGSYEATGFLFDTFSMSGCVSGLHLLPLTLQHPSNQTPQLPAI